MVGCPFVQSFTIVRHGKAFSFNVRLPDVCVREVKKNSVVLYVVECAIASYTESSCIYVMRDSTLVAKYDFQIPRVALGLCRQVCVDGCVIFIRAYMACLVWQE